ncbi:HD-like signal output (HDOD) protein [Sphaerotilus hippei]|uniref:HD-like signal output (HDOD) protein n=1 Tax=Sphaerotilus hippei TaxID=744406 RepID=A0A318H8V5_9BURK|nr:HDOD domain-containing protein [Sphaerotilus hippei]PXW96487.1 HD-like signal output (HDOD) protein [Sphaerotilus hippei]
MSAPDVPSTPTSTEDTSPARPADPVSEVEDEAAAREARLQRLFNRIHERKDFPSLKDSIRSIQKVTRSDLAHMRVLTDEVLNDVALTNKLLRLINTAFYNSVGGGSITTITRAVALMGFEAIGRLAASLQLFDRLPKGSDGARVREEFALALLAATLAHQLCPVRALEENIYVTALFQNLGSMLAWLHFPDDAETIEQRLDEQREATPDPAAPVDLLATERLEREVLGLSYEELGVEIACQWGWPEALQSALRPLVPANLDEPASMDKLLRVTCTAANELARLCIDATPGPELEAHGLAFVARWGTCLAIDDSTIAQTLETSMRQWNDMALVLDLPRKQPPGKTGSTLVATSDAARRKAVKQALNQGMKQLDALARAGTPAEQLWQAYMTMMVETLELQRILICLRTPGPPAQLRGRYGQGDRVSVLMPTFTVPLAPPSDLFGLLSIKAADTLISDASDLSIARHLPAWFRSRVTAQTFLLLPLTVHGQPVGLVYADRRDAGSLAIGDQELTLLKSLRDQLVQIILMPRKAGG